MNFARTSAESQRKKCPTTGSNCLGSACMQWTCTAIVEENGKKVAYGECAIAGVYTAIGSAVKVYVEYTKQLIESINKLEESTRSSVLGQASEMACGIEKNLKEDIDNRLANLVAIME